MRIYELMHRFLSEMAKSVKESGSNSRRQRLLLETEKSAFFHKSNMIADIFTLSNLAHTTICGNKKGLGHVTLPWSLADTRLGCFLVIFADP